MALTEYSCIKCNVLSEPIKGSMGRILKRDVMYVLMHKRIVLTVGAQVSAWFVFW